MDGGIYDGSDASGMYSKAGRVTREMYGIL